MAAGAATARIFRFQLSHLRLKALADGAVAQLGERRNGIAKVRGSIPLGSTIPSIAAEILRSCASMTGALLLCRYRQYSRSIRRGETPAR